MIEVKGTRATLTIDRLDTETYRQFLSVKQLPRYDVSQGDNGDWHIEFPAEYASKFGVDVQEEDRPLPLPLPRIMFDYQNVITRVAWRKKRYACFADAGLGKTLIFLELARQLSALGKKTLIISPLMIIGQTIEEIIKFYDDGYPHTINLHSRGQGYDGLGPNTIESFTQDKKFKIAIVNYDKFRTPHDLTGIDCVIIDESSILKSERGVIRTNLIECTKGIEYKFCFSATPAPNDRIEYTQHAVFLEIVRAANEVYARFFVQKDNRWMLKRHSKDPFYRWLSGWSIFIRNPSAYGFDDNLKDLPPWQEKRIPIAMTQEQNALIRRVAGRTQLQLPGMADKPNGMNERQQYSQISKGFLYHKNGGNGGRNAEYVASNKPGEIRRIIESHPGEQAIVWCVFDEEGELIARELEAHTDLKVAHLTGKTPQNERLELIKRFRHNSLDVMISKPRLLGFGLNFQHCTVAIFSGLQDSYEQYYQAIKRCHRYGQKRTLMVYQPYTPHEEAILQNVLRKQHQTQRDFAAQEQLYIDSLYDELQEYLETDYVPPQKGEKTMHAPVRTPQYELYHVDSIRSMLDGLAENSVDFAIFSPPFRNDLYSYTDDLGDMGNSGGVGERGKYEFMLHFSFFLRGLHRAMKPGRLVACHVMQAPLRKGLDGMVGISDFRGDVIRAFCKEGFYQFGEVVVLKNPQAQSIQKHINTLQMATLARDRSQIVPSFPDYLLVFKKPGENREPIQSDEVSNDEWIEFADAVWQEQQYNAPGVAIPQAVRFDEAVKTWMGVWHDIKETDTLNTPFTRGRTKEIEDADKHVCPLQLGLINRAIRLWSNKGDTVLDPFSGVGSSGYEAVQLGRKYVGMELKPEYFLNSVENLAQAVELAEQPRLL
ncbi:MAG: hypothetical protein GWN93_06695 [Deltaproteobacteria bacterium]|nr:hypothetical protein [Deltaproteobacteria bacterium]